MTAIAGSGLGWPELAPAAVFAAAPGLWSAGDVGGPADRAGREVSRGLGDPGGRRGAAGIGWPRSVGRHRKEKSRPRVTESTAEPGGSAVRPDGASDTGEGAATMRGVRGARSGLGWPSTSAGDSRGQFGLSGGSGLGDRPGLGGGPGLSGRPEVSGQAEIGGGVGLADHAEAAGATELAGSRSAVE